MIKVITKQFILMIVLILICGSSWSAKLYKWIDKNGNVHYSDKLPPDLAKKEHKEISEHGVVLKKNRSESDIRQENKEKQLAAQKSEEDRKRLAAEQAQQALLDKNLLDTYTTESDIKIIYNDRISMIDYNIDIYQGSNKRLNEQLETTKKRITAIKNQNREVPDNIEKKLENLNGQLQQNLSYIKIKQEERHHLEKEFESKLQRFRFLKGIAQTSKKPKQGDTTAKSAQQANPGTGTQTSNPSKQ